MIPAPLVRATALLALCLLTLAATAQPKRVRTRGAPPRPAPVVEAPLPVAPGEQLAAAALTYFGNYECEFNEKIDIDINRKYDGYVDVRLRKSTWTMKPVLSQTGALRLEDVRGRMLMLQIANKSMLMDTQSGHRVVDNCIHQKQREAMANRKDDGDSLGIDPVKAAAVAAAQAAASAAQAASEAAQAAVVAARAAASAASAASAAVSASASAATR